MSSVISNNVQVNVRGPDDLATLASYVVQIDTNQSSTETDNSCTFDDMIIFSHPLSFHEDDSKYALSHLQQIAYEMTIDRINSAYRCGVVIKDKRYGLTLVTYGDNSSKETVAHIAKSLTDTNSTGFLLGPYSSGLTKAMSPIVNDAKRVLVAAGSSQTPVFEGNDYVFGTLLRSEQKLEAAIEALVGLGAKTIAVVHEDGSECAVPYHAEVNGMQLMLDANAGLSPTQDDLDPYVKNLTTLQPDIMVVCGYGDYCGNWVKAMRSNNFSPKAQLFATCFNQLKDDVGIDVQYMMAGTEWHPTMKGIDEVTGWSASDFSIQFEKRSYRPAVYQSASASAAISIVVQALERSDTMDNDVLRELIANSYFPTVKSNLTFDGNGQASGGSSMLQFVGGEDSSDAQVVYPPEKAAEGYSIVYPMPTWEEKDCHQLSQCASSGSCLPDGTCECTNPNDRSIGVGPTAMCTSEVEDFLHVNDGLLAVGYSLFVIQTVLSLFFMVWTIRFRKRSIVKASQPEYMTLICFGVWIIACGILPLSAQGGYYRYMQDDDTGELTSEPNKDIRKVDVACMAYPWLISIGFALTFGALFAKIWRINKVMRGASLYQRVKVRVKDVAGFVIALLAVEFLIMLTWQLVDPLQWQRNVVTPGTSGYPLISVGLCRSENGKGVYFIIVLGVVNICCLLFALYLCYKVRLISSEYQESKWITASVISMFQVAIVGVPVLVIVQNDTDAKYFVNVALLFLLSSTVTLLMFGPKFYQLQFDTESSASVSVVELAGERYKSKNMVKLEETQADSAGHGRQVTFADEEKSNDDVVGAEEEHPIIKTKSMESGAINDKEGNDEAKQEE